MRLHGVHSATNALAEQRSAQRAARARGPVEDEAARPVEGTAPVEAELPPPSSEDQTAAKDDQSGLAGLKQLTPEQEAEVVELQRRDAEVRAHEAAHAAAAGSLGGGASFDYATGPDGRSYAVGGEVPVRISSGRTPEETLRNAAQVRAAALAPAEPSGQDRAVAVEAAAMEAAARAELAARAADTARAMRPAARTEERAPTPAEQPARAGENTTTKAPEPAPERYAPNPDDVIRQLEREQRVARAGWRHLHLEASCGSCGMAAATYR